MRIVVASTLWALFSCFLIFPLASLPAFMHRLAMTLIVAEALALAFWHYGGSELGRTIATVDVPLLAATLVAFVAVRGVLLARRQARSVRPEQERARAERRRQHTRRPRRASRPPAAPR